MMARGSSGESRAAVIDLHRPGRSFIGKGFPETMASELAARACAVTIISGSLPEKGPSRTGIDSRLSALVRNGRFDICIIVNSWDSAAVRLIRSSLPRGSLLVRVSPPGKFIPSAEFDHDLDDKGLGNLLRHLFGSPSKTAASIPIARVALGVEREEDQARLDLEGPRRGCPYLADARRNPVFAGLRMDPRRIRLRGCTFCSDNTGGYSPVPDSVVLDAWLSGLRAGRERSPGVHEYLLLDERPTTLLPSFFKAVADNPKLGPVELLVKCRVDELLRHSKTTIPEAAAEAARSGSVLHLYLIGFENFDPFHLRLFNKGHKVSDNVAAIAELRALERCFPASFEFRKYRTHGFILFTPWTGPEHLITNARMMRAVGFDEVRRGAIRTRLRLYPGSPLHELARRDGLLADSFDPGLRDRAAEQGYNPSSPWRFKDRRTAAVCAAVARLADILPEAPECDILEAATRFVMRWPGVCRVPESAHLPLVTSLQGFIAGGLKGLFDDGGRMVSAFDPEIEGLAAGIREACLKESVPAADVKGLISAYKAMGFAAVADSRHSLDASRSRHIPGASFMSVAVASDKDNLRRFVRLWRLASARAPGAVEAAGTMLGYPPCCSEAFNAAGDVSDNDANEIRPFLARPSAVLHPAVNRLGRFRLLSHHICRPDCRASVKIAETLLKIAGKISPGSAKGVRSMLGTPVLFLDHNHRALLKGRRIGKKFRVEGFTPIGGNPLPEIDPEKIRWLEFDGQALLGRGANGQEARISGDRAILAIPGERCLQRPGPESKRPGGKPAAVSNSIPRANLKEFRHGWLQGRHLPIDLGSGWEISGVSNGTAPDTVNLTISGKNGGKFTVAASPTRHSAPRYGHTKLLDLVFIPASGLPPGLHLSSVLESVRLLLMRGEDTLCPADKVAAFPGSD